MFGVQTLLATGLGSLFTYIVIGVVVALAVYAFYTYFKKQRAPNQAHNFDVLNQQRKTRRERVEGFTAEDTLRFQAQTTDILTGIQQQQYHFGYLIQNFECELQSIQTVGENLDQTNVSLRDRIIVPFQTLLVKMQDHFQIISKQISVLSLALSTTNAAASAREQELSQILESLKKIEPELKSGLSAIGNIQQKLHRRTQHIEKLKRENESLTKSLSSLTEKTKKLADLSDRQRRLIEHFHNGTENTPPPSQRPHRPSTISPNYKYGGGYKPQLFPVTNSAQKTTGIENRYSPFGTK